MPAMAIVTFNYSCSEDELARMAMDFSENVKPLTPGLIWKIFLHRPDSQRSGGLYLFHNLQEARDYLDGSYVRALYQTPYIANISTEYFDIMVKPSALAAAPV